MKPTDITYEALSLPMEEIDKQWVDVAQKRLRELRSGEVNAVSGEEVFKRILFNRRCQTGWDGRCS